MRPSPNLFPVLVALSATAFSSSGSLGETACPSICGMGSSHCSTEPAGSFVEAPAHGVPGGSSSYDLRIATLGADNGNITSADIFVVDQTPAGAPVSIRFAVHFGCEGQNGTAGFSFGVAGRGTVGDAVSLPPSIFWTLIQRDYSIDVDVSPGDSLRVNASTYAGAGFGANIGQARGGIGYQIANPPLGLRLHSCHGYTVDTVTPTRASSWGLLKTRYR